MKNARVEVFEGVGHLIHLEAGERFHASLLSFLAEPAERSTPAPKGPGESR
jgi:pimeloyl-ACP methyl ester carboxylesterase